MKTNEYKEELCKKYKPYLELIDVIGNKIMFQEQFIKLSVLLNIAKDKYIAIKVINQLVSGEIIKRTHFGSKKTKILIFKKFATRFLMGLNSSQSVSAVPKVTTNSRYWECFLKVEFILEKYIPAIQKEQIDLNLNNLLGFLKERNSTILLNKNKGIKFYKDLIENKKIASFVNKDILDEHIKTLEKENYNILKNLNKKQQENNYKCKKRKRKDKWDFLYFSTVNTLLRKNIYIVSITQNQEDDKIKIGCIFADINNTQSYKKAITNLAIAYNFLSKLFNKKIYLTFMVIAQNEIAKFNIKRNLYLKEDLLRKLKVSELDWGNFKVIVTALKGNLEEIEITDPYPKKDVDKKDDELVQPSAPVQAPVQVHKNTRKYISVNFDKF